VSKSVLSTAGRDKYQFIQIPLSKSAMAI